MSKTLQIPPSSQQATQKQEQNQDHMNKDDYPLSQPHLSQHNTPYQTLLPTVAGININAPLSANPKSKPKNTTLTYATSPSSPICITPLSLNRNRGADLEARDRAGKMVLDRAIEIEMDRGEIVDIVRDELAREVWRRCDW